MASVEERLLHLHLGGVDSADDLGETEVRQCLGDRLSIRDRVGERSLRVGGIADDEGDTLLSPRGGGGHDDDAADDQCEQASVSQ